MRSSVRSARITEPAASWPRDVCAATCTTTGEKMLGVEGPGSDPRAREPRDAMLLRFEVESADEIEDAELRDRVAVDAVRSEVGLVKDAMVDTWRTTGETTARMRQT